MQLEQVTKIIKTKSEECLNAAQKLIDSGMYNSSVHCSYYSVFLHMKYILANYKKNPVSYEKQNDSSNGDSHEFILKEIKNRVSSEQKWKDIRQLFNSIKAERVSADYKDKLFEVEDSLDIIDKSKGLHRKLNDQFGKI